MTSTEAVRARIRALQLERDALTSQPLSRGKVADRVLHLVHRWQEEAARSVRISLQHIASGDHASFSDVGINDALGPVLVLLLGVDGVADALLREIEAVPEGVPHEARVQRLSEIASDLDTLETEEEAAIVRAEEDGQTVHRRRDARPEIVLGRG